MFYEYFCFLVVLSNFQATIAYDPEDHLVIDINTNGQSKSELIFSQQFEAPSRSSRKFKLHGFEQGFLSYAVFQLHAFRLNVTLSLDSERKNLAQNGTNLGFVLTPGAPSKSLYMWNDNFDDVQYLVAVIVYNHSAPLVGGCSVDGLDPLLKLNQTEDFIILKTPSAEYIDDQNRTKLCRPSTEFSTYFTYLEQLNFNPDIYFNGIKSLIFDGVFKNGYKAKQVHSPFKRYFERVPGTGLVMNSLIVDEESGQTAFFIPTVTFSCPPNTWSVHCSDIDMLKRALSVCLVFYSIVMIVNLTILDLVESILNGMLIGSSLTYLIVMRFDFGMSDFGVFLTTVFGGLVMALGVCAASMHLHFGRFLTKFTFGYLLMAIIMESYFENSSSIYLQVGGAFVMSLIFAIVDISFSVFLGGLLLIVGLSHLLKVGNIHRLLVNNMHALTLLYSNDSSQEGSLWNFDRYNFINYKIVLSYFDSSLLMFYVIGSVVLTIRKEMYFLEKPCNEDCRDCYDNIEEYNRVNARHRRKKCIVGFQSQHRLNLVSRCRRHHYRSNVIHERSPLISHWIASDGSEDDDEVFVSPASNSRFMRTLSSDSRERLDAIQNFNK